MKTILNGPPAAATQEAHLLWTTMFNSKDYPTDEDTLARIAYEPPEHIFLAQTSTAPNWSRIEWAKQLLTHIYTLTAPEHAAPIPTTIGYIRWWEGRGSKAHQYLQLALDADPGYRFARLSDQMLGAGIIAGWHTNKDTAYKTHLDMP